MKTVRKTQKEPKLSQATAQLLEEVLGYFGESDRQEAQNNPEACIVSMLTAIKEDLPEVSATLRMTIERATYSNRLEEAKKRLKS